jgi:hypothetical protein
MSIKITPKMFAALDSKVQAAISSLVEVKPKRVLSPEHLAKLKAGRETKQALKRLAKLATAEDETLPESIPVIETVTVTVPETEPVAAVEQKKRGPKPLSTKTPEELAAHKAKVAERKAEREAKNLAEPVLPEPVLVVELDEVKPKRTLSAEHLAKLKAGREAAKAKKLAASPEPLPVAEPKPKRTLSPEHLAKLKAGREAAKAKKPVSPEAPRPTIEIPLDSVIPDEPVVAEPVVAEPVVAEPVVAEPVVAEPVVAEPVVAEPVVTEPVVSIPEELAAHKAAKVTFKEPVTEVQPTVAEPKKRGPKPLASKTPEELLAHKLKLEERRAIRKNSTQLLPPPLFKLKSA